MNKFLWIPNVSNADKENKIQIETWFAHHKLLRVT